MTVKVDVTPDWWITADNERRLRAMLALFGSEKLRGLGVEKVIIDAMGVYLVLTPAKDVIDLHALEDTLRRTAGADKERRQPKLL
jgi:hypothetical protein